MSTRSTPKVRAAVAALVLLFSAGCSGTYKPVIVRTGTQVAPPKPAGCPIVFYDAPSDVDRPFTTLAQIETSAGGQPRDTVREKALASAKNAACSVGADAVILKSVDNGEEGLAWKTVVKGSAIRLD